MEARVFSCLLLMGLLWLCGSFGDLITSTAQTTMTLHNDEIAALKIIGRKLQVGFWDFSVDPCSGDKEWLSPTKESSITRNVTCGNCNTITNICHVTIIELKSQNLTGVLPQEFANLTFLTQIDLSRNYISGTIPASWASLPLVGISFLGNRVSGKIPSDIGEISTLQSLILENNLLEGPLPPTLGKLTNLTRLLLSANKFSGGLPTTLGNLKSLQDFRIDGNAFSGRIPSFIGNWTNLTRFDMQGTYLEGQFPPGFSALTKLNELRVTDINGGGTFPPLKRMNLQYLILRNCSITGQVPSYIGQMTKLKRLDLSFNSFTGEIPDTFSQLVASINNMYLTDNRLTGPIPDWILRSSENLDLSYNSFTGSAPSFCQQGNLNLVSSFSSSESNTIIPCLKKNLPCQQKAMNYELFINCGGQREVIDGKTYEIDILNVGPSNFIPSSDQKWAYSSTGDFVGNGDAPYTVTNALALNMTNPELYTTARLSPLSLRYYGLCLQEGNYTVKLHFAEIVFTDDQTFSAPGRRIFDVSIQGKKVLEEFDITREANGTGRAVIMTFIAFVGINGTLEIHFQWVGKGTNAVPYRGAYGPLISAISVTPNFKPYMGEKKLSNGAIIGISVASCVLGFMILILLVFCWRKMYKADDDLEGLESQTSCFSLRQIKSATNNFDPANKIGEGGFGPVFKGVLLDGTVIAVKQLSSKSKQGNREFLNEIGIISAVQHPNLVKLFGCCIGGNQLLLIYEYLENNSLARALFGPEGVKLNLPWQRRRKISLDIARGLAYLHEESRLKIVHRDIKATNVLLDKDLNAKISDFGLAKLDEEENTHISTRIAGTVGYMAPEYAMRGYLTDKADVYSYGIVLLEIVSGKSNTNYRPKEEFVYLLDWAYVLQEQGNMLELVDPILGSNYSKEEAEKMLKLALVCTNPSPTLRPTMSTVVSMLEGHMPVQVPSMMGIKSESEGLRFRSFQQYSHDSQGGISTDRSWTNSTNMTTHSLTQDQSAQSLLTDEKK